MKINYKLFTMGLLVSTLAFAQTPQSLKTLFPQKSDILINQTGWQRIDLSPEIRSKIQADYSDLRIFDVQGKETPFFIGQYQGPKEVPASQSQALKVLNAKREKVKEDIYLETYEIEIPTALNPESHYSLLLKSSQDNFVKQMQILNKSDKEDGALLESASLFRYGSSQEKMSVDWDHKGVHKISFSLEGEGNYLEPTFYLLQENKAAATAEKQNSQASRKDVLQILERLEEPGKTILMVNRPSGVVPQALLLENTHNNYSRSVKIYDLKKGQQARLIGSGKIFNRAIVSEVENDKIKTSSALGEKLKIEIENGESPVLPAISVESLSSHNLLFFFVDPKGFTSSAQTFGTLYFGAARVKSPRYDLQDLAQGVDIEKLFSSSHEVQLSAETANGDYVAEKSFEDFLKPGIKQDPQDFAYSQTLKVSAPGGIVSIPLSLEHLEKLRKDLGDFRILDKDLQQWPYQLSRDSREVKIELTVQKQTTSNQKTSYKISNPHPKIDLNSLQIKIEDAYFDRAYQLVLHKGEVNEKVLANGRLYRQPGSLTNITISLGRVPFDSLDLIVTDGIEQALNISQATSTLETPVFTALLKTGEYSLYFGNPTVTFPTYEITQFKDLVENLQEAPSELGAIQKNALESKISQTSRQMGGGGVNQFYLWILLGVALVVLAIFSLRLAKGGDGK